MEITIVPIHVNGVFGVKVGAAKVSPCSHEQMASFPLYMTLTGSHH